jgi:replication-associated recombination protein RarA
VSEAVKFADRLTPGGHLCGEVASALQKSIRRGEERDALYWATELELAGFGAYVWKRLRIIASEDVGIADSNVAVQVRALYDDWLDLKRKSGEGYEGFHRVKLLHAVVILARAPKSRALDHALMWLYAGERPKQPIPDYALDWHTKRGRQMGRGVEHFLEEGAKLVNETLDDPYRDEGHAALLQPHKLKTKQPQQEPPTDQLELDEQTP